MKEGENMSNLNEICHTVRKDIVSTLVTAGCGHPGGSLSAVEIVTTLYFDKMHIDPANPRDPNRDRFVLSKGHATLMMYSVLAERGYFPVEELKTFRKNWSRLPGHPDMNKVPGIDMTTGSLGQGLAVANGMALAGRAQGKDYYCYALLGDGELQEGMVWEAAMAAAHYKLDHVIAFVDRNGLQIDGTTEQVMGLEPLADKCAVSAGTFRRSTATMWRPSPGLWMRPRALRASRLSSLRKPSRARAFPSWKTVWNSTERP